MGKHYGDEDLINRLYEIGDDDAHLEECDECRARWLQLVERRRLVLKTPQVSAALLTQQRRSIYQRLDEDRAGSWFLRPAPTLAAISMLVLGVLLLRPSPQPQPMLASNDTQFYTEIYSIVENTEPEALTPIYGLFEVQP